MDKLREEYIEKTIIELSIYYKLATSKEDDTLKLEECANIINYEIDMLEKDETIFKVEPEEHIINKLKNELKNIDKEQYKEYLQSVYYKISYYDSTVNGLHLMDISSEEDVEEFAYELLYYSKGIEELKAESKTNVYAKYELAERYYYANMYDKAYKLFEDVSEGGHKKATYMKIVSLYLGRGIEKDEQRAFNELTKFVEDRVYFKGRELLGEMYYYGKGTEQDYKKALESFKEAEGILASAEYYLGLMYINGQGVEVDEKKGLDYIIGAAQGRYKKAIEYIIDNAYKKDKSESLSLDDLFDEAENNNSTSEDDNEWQEYAEEFFEKFGRYSTIPEPDGTEKESIEAIKQCLEKDEDIYDKIIFEGRYDFEGSEDALF